MQSSLEEGVYIDDEAEYHDYDSHHGDFEEQQQQDGLMQEEEELALYTPPSQQDKKDHLIKSVKSLIIFAAIILFVSSLIVALVFILQLVKPYLIGISDDKYKKLKRTVFLFSIDSFRPDYMEIYASKCPNMKLLADNGVSVDKITPIFPTTSFPNHWSMVTGLSTARHGIIGNRMYNRESNQSFVPTNNETEWWNGATPIWTTVGEHNFSSAVFYWPGSNVPGMTPTYYKPVYEEPGPREKIDEILHYLDADLSKAKKNHKTDDIIFYATVFITIDLEGHSYGAQGRDTSTAVAYIDDALGYFLSELERRSIDPFEDVNIILTSDHGMADLSGDCFVHIGEILTPEERAAFHMPNMGAYVDMISVKGTSLELIDKVYLKLKQHEQQYKYTAYKWEELAEQFQWNTSSTFSDRVPEIVVIMNLHCSMATGFYMSNRGEHGYHPTHSDMAGFFIASGPKFIQSKQHVHGFQTVDVYSVLTHAMELNDSMIPKHLDSSFDKVKHLFEDTYQTHNDRHHNP